MSATGTEQSPASNEIQAIIPVVGPNNVSVVTNGSGELTVSWGSAPGATSYHIMYTTEASPADIRQQSSAKQERNVTSPFTLTGLTDGLRYRLIVLASVTGSAADVPSLNSGGMSYADTPKAKLLPNDTGVDRCANATSHGLDCAYDPYGANQDARHGRDAQATAGTLTKVGGGAAGFDFTKLDENGNTLAASATEWSCVRDNYTGLIWEEKTADGGLRDKSNVFYWYNPDIPRTFNQMETGDSCTLADTCNMMQYRDRVNQLELCGGSNWDVPTLFELVTITHFGKTPSVDNTYFANNPTLGYWLVRDDTGRGGTDFQGRFGIGVLNADIREGLESGNRVIPGPLRLVRRGNN